MHKYRISFLAGLGAGFVLGARAGRERYEQLMKTARAVADNPAVQQAAGAVQAQATGLVTSAGSKLTDGVRERVPQLAKTARAKVGGHVPGARNKNGPGGHESNGRGENGPGENGRARGFTATTRGHGSRH